MEDTAASRRSGAENVVIAAARSLARKKEQFKPFDKAHVEKHFKERASALNDFAMQELQGTLEDDPPSPHKCMLPHRTGTPASPATVSTRADCFSPSPATPREAVSSAWSRGESPECRHEGCVGHSGAVGMDYRQQSAERTQVSREVRESISCSRQPESERNMQRHAEVPRSTCLE